MCKMKKKIICTNVDALTKEPIERKTLKEVSTRHPPYKRESYSF